MGIWLTGHWSELLGGLLTLLSLIGTWRFGPRVKLFLAGRFDLERENFYLRRENAILVGYIDRVDEILSRAGIDVSKIDSSDGSESRTPAIPPNRTTSRKPPQSPPP